MNIRILLVAFLLMASSCYADGLDALINVAKGQTEMQKVYAEETKAYDKIESAVERGAVEKGQTKEEIEARYGEPVVAIDDEDTNREKWIYKPSSSSFFNGPKLYLYFTVDDKLDEIKKVE